jgi:hypothetical protein
MGMGAMGYVRNWQRFKAGMKPSKYARHGG